jgi:REP element-mobilizing transposase RayT
MIWSTKNRQRFLHGDVRSRVHSYMAKTLRSLGCEAVNVGGTEDHVHVVCFLAKKHAPMDVIRTVKADTSRRVKTFAASRRDFAWQNGYGIFSVSPADFEMAVDYVKKQAEHHRKMTFREEFMRFIRKYDIPHDERYMWD